MQWTIRKFGRDNFDRQILCILKYTTLQLWLLLADWKYMYPLKSDMKSQVDDKQQQNAPIPGRCY